MPVASSDKALGRSDAGKVLVIGAGVAGIRAALELAEFGLAKGLDEGASPVELGERGASLTEFAVVVPLFLALVYGSLHLCDLGVFKLKAQEIARYGAWGLTQRPLSNYGDARFNHEHAFDDARDDEDHQRGDDADYPGVEPDRAAEYADPHADQQRVDAGGDR